MTTGSQTVVRNSNKMDEQLKETIQVTVLIYVRVVKTCTVDKKHAGHMHTHGTLYRVCSL
jgi:hypothetical protein